MTKTPHKSFKNGDSFSICVGLHGDAVGSILADLRAKGVHPRCRLAYRLQPMRQESAGVGAMAIVYTKDLA